jgi:catechol 2,3-dioxygenase
VISSSEDFISLGVLNHKISPLVELILDPGATPVNRHSPGLYHFALLLPERYQLGQFLIALSKSGYTLDGASDHLVSEALYLSDPDGNGIEVYWDRPRNEWQYDPNGEVKMSSDPINFDTLLKDGMHSSQDWSGMPIGTKIGHMHLQVSDIERSAHFYNNVVGLDIMNSKYPGARFLSAWRYHHHLGLNTWQVTKPKLENHITTGLDHWEILLPDQASKDKLITRLAEANCLLEQNSSYYGIDPDGIKFRLSLI